MRAPSGGSRCASGRDDIVPLKVSTAKVPAWIPPSAIKRDASSTNDNDFDDEEIFRKVRGILNKISPEKFDKLSVEFCRIPIRNQKVLKGVIVLIFDKALTEPSYSFLYAQLCQRLDKVAPNFELPGSPITSFRKLLLTVCQHEFDNRSKYLNPTTTTTTTSAFPSPGGLVVDAVDIKATAEYNRQAAKKKMLGNVKFIGELGKLDLLNEAILHKCIRVLLEKQKDERYADMADDLECLCKMMPSIGKKLDQGEAIKLMDQYFERIKKLRWLGLQQPSGSGGGGSPAAIGGSASKDLPQRIRFLLQDIIDLRQKGWQPRQTQIDQAPKTITDVRSGAIIEEMQAARANALAAASSAPAVSGAQVASWMLSDDAYYQQLSAQPNMSLLNAINSTIAASKKLAAQQQQVTASTTTTTADSSSSSDESSSTATLAPTTTATAQQEPTGNSCYYSSNSRVIRTTNTTSLVLAQNILNSDSGGSCGSSSGNAVVNRKPPVPSTSMYATNQQEQFYGGRNNNNNNARYNYANSNSNNFKQQQPTFSSTQRSWQQQPQQQNINGTNSDIFGQQTSSSSRFLTNNSSNRSNANNVRNMAPTPQQQPSASSAAAYRSQQQQQVATDSAANSMRSMSITSSTSSSSSTSSISASVSPSPPLNTTAAATNTVIIIRQPLHQQHTLHTTLNEPTAAAAAPVLLKTKTPPPAAPGATAQVPQHQQQSFSAVTSNVAAAVAAAPHTQPFLPAAAAAAALPPPLDHRQLPSSNRSYYNNRYHNTSGNSNYYNPHYQQLRTALGVSTNEVLPLNKPIIPLEKIMRQDTKHHYHHHQQQHNKADSAATSPPLAMPPAPTSPNQQQMAAASSSSTSDSLLTPELTKRVSQILDEYLADEEPASGETVMRALRALRLNGEQLSDAVRHMIVHSLGKSDQDRLNVSRLFIEMHRQLITSDQFMGGFRVVLQLLASLESEYHLVKSHIALYAARAVCDQVITFHELASMMKHGAYYPLFFLCMQKMHKIKPAAEWLRTQLERSKVNLVDMLAAADRSKERLVQILEDRELSFVYPMLKIESALLDKISEDTASRQFSSGGEDGDDQVFVSSLRKWINENVSDDVCLSVDFVQSLVTCVIQNAADKSGLLHVLTSSGVNSKIDKATVDKLKQLIKVYQKILQDYLNSNLSKQVEAIYAMQVYAESKGYPKYFLTHLFHQMYDLDIIDEEAFYMWKDELNENYPNKGKALFNLQRWFNWLQEAPEESGSSDVESPSSLIASSSSSAKQQQQQQSSPTLAAIHS